MSGTVRIQYLGMAPPNAQAEFESDVRELGLGFKELPDPLMARSAAVGTPGPVGLLVDFVYDHAETVITGVFTTALTAGLAKALTKLGRWYGDLRLRVITKHKKRGVDVTYSGLPLRNASELQKLLDAIPRDFALTIDATETITGAGSWRTWHVSIEKSTNEWAKEQGIED